MSIIVDALQKAGRISSTPSPAPSPPRRFLWFYRGLLIGTVMLILIIVSNEQFRHLFAPSAAPPPEVPFYASSLLPFPTPSTTPSPTPSIQPPPAPAPPPPPAQEPPEEKLVIIPQPRWNLSGIMLGGPGESLAIINGRLVAEGDTFEGVLLVQIDPNQVELLIEDEIETLVLAGN